MKAKWYLAILALITFSCKRDGEFPDTNPDEESSKQHVEQIDLSEGGLPLAIFAKGLKPDDLQAKWNETFGRMELTKDNSLTIFISQDTLSCKARKRDIESGIFEISYIEDTDSLIFYKTTLPDGSIPYWHFFASFELNKINYNFENDPLIECTEKQIKLMTELIMKIRQPEVSTPEFIGYIMGDNKFGYNRIGAK